MATTDISVATLESLQPAVDYKKSGRYAILKGRNFAWDASGVYSAYASRLIAGNFSLGLNPAIVQGLDMPDMSYVAVAGTTWKFTPASLGSPVGAFTSAMVHTPLVNANLTLIPYDWTKWYSTYLGGNRYTASYNYGVFRFNSAGVITRLTNGTVPGFPPDTDPVIAVCETNGRLCFITKTTFYWSAPNAPENLVPALGGAGFQVINERISGDILTLIPVAGGAIIWTTGGALVCEFIGGDAVFRFYPLKTNLVPSSAYAISRLPDDDYVILTRLGIFRLSGFNQPQPIVPLFNEFLREYLRVRPMERGHIWYSVNDNRLYVSFRPQNIVFSETYALDLTLDRWGIFSEYHMGLFNYGPSRGQMAYATDRGVPCFFLSNTDERKNREVPSAPGTYVGVDSEIEIGWMRAQNIIGHADVVQELQEIQINKKPLVEESVTLTYVDEGLITGIAGFPVVDEGLMVNFASFPQFDEGFIYAQETDYTYQLEIVGDMFDDDRYDITIPDLVKTTRNGDLWVGLSPAIYHRLRLKAINANEYFRINSFDITVAYSGNIS
jgi:hypothetical protein